LLKIGLTGGIGSGKSSVAARFANFGTPIIDADQVTRDLMSPGGRAYQALVFWLGQDYFNKTGELDRKKLRHLVFNDPQRLNKLESIVHPLVGDELLLRLNQVPEDRAYVIFEIPLLSNKHKEFLVDRVLVVDCTEETQITRSTARDNTTAEQIKLIMEQQLSRKARLALADDVINNDGRIEELDDQVEKLHKSYLDLATDQPSLKS